MDGAFAALRRGAALFGLAGITLLLALGAAQGQGQAGGKELVAVLDLDALGASKNQVAAVSERLREELLATGRYRIVDRAQMDKVMQEQALQQTGCTSQECAVQVGRILGVRKLITGKVNRVEANLWLISCAMIDAESAEIVRAVSFQHAGDFGSLLADGAPQLVGKLTDGASATASVRSPSRPARLAGAALQVVDVPPEAEVFLNGASKGKGPQQFNDLAPGPYEVIVRRTAYRPFRASLTLAPGQAAKVEPKFESVRLAIFPIKHTGSWATRDNEEYTAGWVNRAVHSAALAARFSVTQSVHTKDSRATTKFGADLRQDADLMKNAWTFFGNPDTGFAAKKGKELDVDAVLYLSITTGVSSSSGGWKVQLVDVRTGTVTDDSGTWPYGAQSGPALSDAVTPLLDRFVKGYR